MRGLLFFFLSIVLSVASVSKAQLAGDTLSMFKTGAQYYYFHGEQEVRFFDLLKITQPNKEARTFMKYAKNNYSFANVFFGMGIISFGYGCMVHLDSGDQDKIMSGIKWGAILGCSMVLVSIPLYHGKHKNTRKAITVYNASM